VVRYTAGGTIGYKADVTYEGDDPRNLELAKSVPSQPQPSSSRPNKNFGPKKYSGPSNSNSYNSKDGPTYRSRPGKSRRPTQSPFPSYPNNEGYPQSASPSPYPSARPSPTGPTGPSSFYNGNNVMDSTSRPKSIYDKIPSSSSQGKKQQYKEGTLSYQHDQSPRAGPSKYGGSSNSGYHIEASPTKESYYSNSKSNPTKDPSYYSNSNSNPTKEPSYYSNSNSNPTKEPSYYSNSNSNPTKQPSYYSNSNSNPTKQPSYYSNSNSNPTNEPSYYDDALGHGPPYFNSGPTAPSSPLNYINPRSSPKPTKLSKIKASTRNYHEEDIDGPSTYTPIKSSGKSGSLIPIDDFKAGPSQKKFRKNKQQGKQSNIPEFRGIPDLGPTQPQPSPFPPSNQNYQYLNQKTSNNNGPRSQSLQPYDSPSYNEDSPPSSGKYKEPFHYFNSQHPSFHHGGFPGPAGPQHSQPSPAPPIGIHQQQVNPATSAYSIDYPGGGKQSFYLKSGGGQGPGGGPSRPFKSGRRGNGNRKSKTSSGLVYLETPGVGPRPNSLGVKEALDRLPNMPSPRNPSHFPSQRPKTSIHAYEVGSKDFGDSVGYKNSENYRDTHDDDGHGQYDFRTPDNNNNYVPQLNTNHFDLDHNNQHDSPIGHYHRDYLYDSSPDSIVQPQPQQLQPHLLDQSTVDESGVGVDQAAELAYQY
jgi:hypothetical protein